MEGQIPSYRDHHVNGPVKLDWLPSAPITEEWGFGHVA